MCSLHLWTCEPPLPPPLRLCLHVCMCFLLVGNQSFHPSVLRGRRRGQSWTLRTAQKEISWLFLGFLFWFFFPLHLLPPKRRLPRVLGDERMCKINHPGLRAAAPVRGAAVTLCRTRRVHAKVGTSPCNCCFEGPPGPRFL